MSGGLHEGREKARRRLDYTIVKVICAPEGGYILGGV